MVLRVSWRRADCHVDDGIDDCVCQDESRSIQVFAACLVSAFHTSTIVDPRSTVDREPDAVVGRKVVVSVEGHSGDYF